MTRLEVLSRLPEEARNLLRKWEGNLEEYDLARLQDSCDGAALDELEGVARRTIRGLLSVYYRDSELDVAVAALERRG